jgi:hypothetical protein
MPRFALTIDRIPEGVLGALSRQRRKPAPRATARKGALHGDR